MDMRSIISKYFTLFQCIIWIHISAIGIAQNTPVTQNGQLKVCGTQLCNQYNKPIQLRGMSTHGIQWYGWGNCLTESSLDALAYDWDADILRISLYVQEGGYETDPVGFTNQVSRLINEATERGMYALVDWHQLNPGDPNSNLENAKRFFKDIANQHKNKNNIIYDVCNEPNGSGVTWNRIKTYADQIIPVIREIDDDAVVLVGTHGWATFGVSGEGNLQDVIGNPLQFQNVMYTFHFYANSHREAYLNRLDEASNRLPVFVTEFGSQEFTGDGPNDFPMTQQFIDLMQRKKISWTSWNYSDDTRSGAAWKTGTCSGGPWTINQLKPAGSWIRNKIKFPADDFPGGDPTGDTQTAFGGTPWPIPGKIEVENYDIGGQNIAFNDLSINNEGGKYRNDAVDIEVCTEGGYNVGWTKTGEWLEYTVNIVETKTYLLESRVAAISSGKKFHIEVDGQNISNQISVPNIGGWQNWETVTTTLSLNKGIRILRIVMDSDDFNINHLVFKNSGTSSNQPPSISIVSPQQGESYAAGQEVPISVNANDSDGTIDKVLFFIDGNQISEDNSYPYQVNWTATSGNHSVVVVAKDNANSSTTSSTINITVGAISGNCNLEQYRNGETYQTGDEVQNLGGKFRCLVGGWCSLGGPYTPGGPDDWAWPSAWKKIGDCNTIAPLREKSNIVTTNCDVVVYQNGNSYATGDEVQNLGKKYKCKVGGWCSLGGVYTPGGPDTWAWPSAWEDLGTCSDGEGNQLPTIAIVSPTNGNTFESGETVRIKVDATDLDGSIVNITFLMDEVEIGQISSTPFEFSFSPVDGDHILKAIATDNEGGSTQSKEILISVKSQTGSDGCSTAQYIDGKTYQTGDEVQNLGNKYRCKVGGWCSLGGAYTPGGSSDWAWPNAWEELGPCQEGNLPPQVAVLTSNIIYTDALPVTVPLRARIIDTDGIQTPVYVNILGEEIPLSQKGEDIYETDWSFSEYKTYVYTAQATDNKGNATNFSFEITIKKSSLGDNTVLSKVQYDEFFSYRYGTDLNTYELDPAKDFYTYDAFNEAIARMATIEVTFERRKGTNLYRLTRKDKTTNQSSIIRTDPDFDASWNQSKPIITQVIDYGVFAKEGNDTVRKRELAAFLANIAQETTGGWDTAPGGRYSWGLYFREEQGYEGTNNIGYRDENNLIYPPAPGKSYHGRGPIQLSYNYNYGQVSEFLFGDKNVLLANPEQIIQDGALAFQTAIWFWMTPQYPKPSAHDVMVGNWTPSNYDLERNRTPGFGMTINIINGGVECGKGTEINKVLHRIGHYNRFSDILGVNNDLDTTDDCSECGCAQMTPFTGLEPESDEVSGKVSNYDGLKTIIDLFPNPFNNEIHFSFKIDQDAKIRISIIDINGNQVTELLESPFSKGSNTITKDVTKLPSGMYFCKIQIGRQQQTFKMIKK